MLQLIQRVALRCAVKRKQNSPSVQEFPEAQYVNRPATKQARVVNFRYSVILLSESKNNREGLSNGKSLKTCVADF